MGRTETYFAQCRPEDVKETISVYENFGWSVIGTQQITDDKGVDNKGKRHYETYTKITFSRDADIPNKTKLVSLQKEYDGIIEEARKNQNNTLNVNLRLRNSVFLDLIIAVVLFLGSPSKIISLFLIVFGALVTLISFLNYSSNKKDTVEINKKLKRAGEAVSEARSYL